MLASLLPVRSLLGAIFVLMAGGGVLSTLTGVRLEAEGAGTLQIGNGGAAAGTMGTIVNNGALVRKRPRPGAGTDPHGVRLVQLRFPRAAGDDRSLGGPCGTRAGHKRADTPPKLHAVAPQPVAISNVTVAVIAWQPTVIKQQPRRVHKRSKRLLAVVAREPHASTGGA